MAIYVIGGTNSAEKVDSVAEAQSLFEHYVNSEEKVSVWVGQIVDSQLSRKPADAEPYQYIHGKEVWKYDPDALTV